MLVAVGAQGRLWTEDKVVKASDEIVNNSNTLQADNELLYALEANSIYLIEVYLFVSSLSDVPDLKIGFTAPAGALGQALENYCVNTGSNVVDQQYAGASHAARIEATQAFYYPYRASVAIKTTNAGNFVLMWSQSTAVVEDTKILTGSFLHIRKIV